MRANTVDKSRKLTRINQTKTRKLKMPDSKIKDLVAFSQIDCSAHIASRLLNDIINLYLENQELFPGTILHCANEVQKTLSILIDNIEINQKYNQTKTR